MWGQGAGFGAGIKRSFLAFDLALTVGLGRGDCGQLPMLVEWASHWFLGADDAMVCVSGRVRAGKDAGPARGGRVGGRLGGGWIDKPGDVKGRTTRWGMTGAGSTWRGRPGLDSVLVLAKL